MKKEEIIASAQKNKEGFIEISQSIPYELRGILPSEALLVVSLAKAFGVKLLIESGRARGYSTKLFAEFFKDDPDFKIISIDYDKNSSDVKYSQEQLKNYNNVKLLHGDARAILHDQISEPCVVFIDGPKGDDALLLAADVLNRDEVRAVFIHDLHKNTFHRNICEIIFKKTFFSDNVEYVERFKYLDEHCWKKLQSEGEAPYVRNGKSIRSYGSTVAVVFRDQNKQANYALQNYRNYYKSHKSNSVGNRVLNKTIAVYKKLTGGYV